MIHSQIPTKSATTLATLLAEGRLTQHQIAKKIGCSRPTVARAAKKIKLNLTKQTDLVSAYSRELRKRVPIATRVAKYAEIIEKGEHKVALNALIRADELTGIVTEKDKLRAIRETDERRQGPMFLMAPGSTVQVLDRPSESSKQHTQDLVATDQDDHK